MTLYLHPDDSVLFGRPSVDRSDPDTDYTDITGGSGPRKVLISLTSRCNLRCAHCIRGAAPHLVPKDRPEEMSREILDAIIEQLFPKARAVLIGGYDLGEQTLSKHFVYVLEQALNYPDLTLELLTNGSQLLSIPGELLARAVSRIHISLEGYGESYRSVRGIPWTTLERNLDHILDARDRWPRHPRQVISLALCVMRPHLREYFRLIDYAQKVGIDLIEARDFYPNGYSDSENSLAYFEKTRADFYRDLAAYAASHNVVFSGPQAIPAEPEARRARPRALCSAPFELMGFHTDGSVFVCDSELPSLGTLSSRQESIETIWRSPAYTELRRHVNSDNPPGPCRKCLIVNLNPLVYRKSRSAMFAQHVYSRIPLTQTPMGRRFTRLLRRITGTQTY